MAGEAYRNELRNHFFDQMKNSKLQTSTQYYKDQSVRAPPPLSQAQQQIRDFDVSSYHASGHTKPSPARNSGGDADRAIYEANYGDVSSSSYRRNNDTNYMRQLHVKANTNKLQPPPALPSSSIQAHKYRQDDMYETDSNIGGGGGGSEESGKSQKSSKTVVSNKSSHELRKMVKSQCKLHEVIDETLKQMCSTDGEREPMCDEVVRLKEPPHPQNCKRCTDKGTKRSSSQKDEMTEIGKGDFLDCRSGDTLTISVDDVVNSKVINPMIRKLQRMYLNNLKEEMSLMEDLERLPHKVNEVYKATIFKQKE